MISIWSIKQNISDLEFEKEKMTKEGKDAAERVIDDLEKFIEMSKEFLNSISE